jgi:glycosyltransferase involved in cell wall biosynthesis
LSEPLVTIAIPIYRRLHYLPQALQSVVAQGYPAVDLIVSDNGENTDEVRKIVERHYPGPFRFRRNERTVSVDGHFNQLLREARGEYFLVLADDDQLGDNFLHGLVGVLREDPAIGVAIARIRVIDEEGREVDAGVPKREPPARMSAAEFVRMWCRGEYDFVTFLTVMCRTEDLRRTGGYPDFPVHGTSIDDAVVLRLAVGGQVAWVRDAVFRNRVYEASHGLSLPIRELALDLRRYMRFLDRDETLQDYATREADAWREIRALQRKMTWRTYRYRWRHMYRQRMGFAEWAKAAFWMPPIPAYYASVLPQVFRVGLSNVKARVRRDSAA